MSMNYADLYGIPSDLSISVMPTAVAGPNQGSVMPPTGKVPPTVAAGGASSTVAFSWLGLIILLVAWRLLSEMAS